MKLCPRFSIAIFTILLARLSTGICAENTDVQSTIFGDAVLRRNVYAVCEEAEAKPDDVRHKFLAEWVFPHGARSGFRVTGTYVPFTETFGKDPRDQIRSPALDLIRSAKKLRQLPALRDAVDAVAAENDSVRRQRAALHFLIDMANEDVTAAKTSLEEFAELPQAQGFQSMTPHWPLLLVLSRAVSDPEFDFLTTELLLHYVKTATMDFENPHIDVFLDHVRWLDGLKLFCGRYAGQLGEFTLPPSLKHWRPISFVSATTHGQGRPQAHWQRTDDGLQKLAGHEMDYLLFDRPLRGNYQVECDVSFASGVKGSVLVAGTHLEPADDRSQIKLGSFRADFSDIHLTQPMSPLKNWIRYRAVVQNLQITVFLNGKHVYSRTLTKDHNPWVGLRGWRRARCDVRDIRITGTPTVPETVSMIGDENLYGWAPYYTEEFGRGRGSWQPLKSEGTVGIVSPQRRELTGTLAERLLRYQRPMFENGSIEYEFFYRAGSNEVHPALGRTCFLLNNDGVKLHRITDGVEDRSSREPAATMATTIDHKGNVPLPLNEDAWNRLELKRQGDAVQLILNEQFIGEQQLSDDNDHVFGLFHYADQTQARVRNIRWRGDWPKQMPAADMQELRSREVDAHVAGAAKLPAVFEHDFAGGRALHVLDIMGDKSTPKQVDDGLWIQRQRSNGVSDIRFTFGVAGDFDFELRFRDFVPTRPEPKKGGFGLMVFFDGESQEDYAIWRRPQKPGQQHRAAWSYKYRSPDGKQPYKGGDIPEESLSGRLRLSRRGKTMSAHYAEEDSPNFRLVDTREVTDRPTLANGLRIVMQAEGTNTSELVLENVVLRAEKFIATLPDMKREQEIVDNLNRQRDNQQRQVLDFAKPDTFSGVTGDLPPKRDIVFTESGLRVEAISLGSDVSYHQTFRKQGILDAEVDVGLHEMDFHRTGTDHCKYALIANVNSDSLQSAMLTVIQLRDGTREIVAELTELRPDGKLVSRQIRSLPVDTPTRLRLTFYDQKLCFLYAELDSDKYRLLAEVPLATQVTASELVQRTGAIGRARRVDVTWKTLTVYHMDEK